MTSLRPWIPPSIFHLSWLTIQLSQSTDATRCGFRGDSRDPWAYHEQSLLPLQQGFKECRWGCCWEQHDDICCHLSKEVIVTGVVAVTCVLLLLGGLALLVCVFYLRRSRPSWRSAVGLGSVSEDMAESPSSIPCSPLWPMPTRTLTPSPGYTPSDTFDSAPPSYANAMANSVVDDFMQGHQRPFRTP